MDTSINFGDRKTRYQRMGYGNVYKEIARGIVLIAIFVGILVGVATMFTNMATAQIEAKTAITQVRYQNTHK